MSGTTAGTESGQHEAVGGGIPPVDALTALAILGQDLRSVLVGTAGVAELACAQDSPEPMCLERIRRGLDGALGLVDDLLSFADTYVGDASRFTPAELIGECIARARAQVSQDAVVIRSVLSSGSDRVVHGDRGGAELLITLLLRRAIGRASRGEISVMIGSVEAEAGADLCLTIADGVTGAKALAYDREAQLVRGVAAQLDGELFLTDTECRLRLPCHHGESSGAHEAIASNAPIMRGRTALVVDDDPALRQVYTTLLEDLGASCDEAADGLQALERCRTTHYDVVLMDLNMPRMDGFAATRAICRLEQEPPPIVAITALSDRQVGVDCLAAGAVRCLRKPLQRPQVEAALRDCLTSDAEQPEPVITPEAFDPDGPRQTLELMGGGADAIRTIRSLLESFQVATPGMVAELRAAISSEDSAAVRRLTHTLKSRAAALGLVGAAAAAAELEDRAADDQLGEAASALLTDFESARAAGIDPLEAYLSLEAGS
ncbi:MAG: response regulator [Planctomycetota bacterium]|jgi:CheY-like chemotaxis protein/HPt (histidine-containing phosphotransfer) domain-containing protein|nr:response regulator [Planctomycetota bacterium]